MGATAGLDRSVGQWHQVAEATKQLFLNMVILLIVGVGTLVVQRRFWTGHPTGPVRTAMGE